MYQICALRGALSWTDEERDDRARPPARRAAGGDRRRRVGRVAGRDRGAAEAGDRAEDARGDRGGRGRGRDACRRRARSPRSGGVADRRRGAAPVRDADRSRDGRADGLLSLFSDRFCDHTTVRYTPKGTPLARAAWAPDDDDEPFVACGVDVLPELHLPPHSSAFIGVEGPAAVPGSAARMGSRLALPRDAYGVYWDDVWLPWRRRLRPGNAGEVGIHQLLGYAVGDDTGAQGLDDEVLIGFDSGLSAMFVCLENDGVAEAVHAKLNDIDIKRTTGTAACPHGRRPFRGGLRRVRLENPRFFERGVMVCAESVVRLCRRRHSSRPPSLEGNDIPAEVPFDGDLRRKCATSRGRVRAARRGERKAYSYDSLRSAFSRRPLGGAKRAPYFFSSSLARATNSRTPT